MKKFMILQLKRNQNLCQIEIWKDLKKTVNIFFSKIFFILDHNNTNNILSKSEEEESEKKLPVKRG